MNPRARTLFTNKTQNIGGGGTCPLCPPPPVPTALNSYVPNKEYNTYTIWYLSKCRFPLMLGSYVWSKLFSLMEMLGLYFFLRTQNHCFYLLEFPWNHRMLFHDRILGSWAEDFHGRKFSTVDVFLHQKVSKITRHSRIVPYKLYAFSWKF